MIEMYTKKSCAYCQHAKNLLNQYQLAYTEFAVDQDPQLFEEMIAKSQGKRTVPQIFINKKLIGGYTDLLAFEQNGGLNQWKTQKK